MNIISLFSGCGGLDLGFEKAGFRTLWANEYDKSIWETYKANFPNTNLNTKSIINVSSDEIPNNITGIIGGPPCQSWSEAGSRRGMGDERGKVFFEYVRILREKKPIFFLAENVSGILHKTHSDSFSKILESFKEIGYDVNYKLLNAKHYLVPQDRKRVIIVGFRKDQKINNFQFPEPNKEIITLKEAIYDLRDNAQKALDKNKGNITNLDFENHEYMNGGFSTMFMSRNRVRGWDEPSFTIQAGGRHAPIHPQAPAMLKVEKDKFEFQKNKESLYRRLSVRECARVQTFPDHFKFKYNSVVDGYKMVGNAVPVNFAYALANQIKNYIT
jgi:DNA (cytosine-5)-methyltransferase 1